MTEKDKINYQARQAEEQKEIKALEAKYQDMTHCEALSGFYWWCKVAKYFFGGFSVILGLGLPLMMAHKMPSVAGIVFTIFLFVLISMEGSKGWVMEQINRLRIINKSKVEKIPMGRFLFAACFLFAANVAISFFSTPFIVDTLIEPSGLEDIALIDTTYEHKKQVERERFEAAKKEFQAQADTIKALNIKANGTLKSAVVRTHAEMAKGATRQLDSLTACISALNREHSKKVGIAEYNNAEIMKEHKAFCGSFSWWSALAACIIEILLVTLAWWIADFDHKKLGELREKAKIEDEHIPLEQPIIKPIKEKIREEEKIKVKDFENQDVKRIGFVFGDNTFTPKEGDIIPPQGRKSARVYVMVGGELRPMKKSQLNILIKGQSTESRKEHLINLLKKLGQ